MYTVKLSNGLSIQIKDKELQAVLRMLNKNEIQFVRFTHKYFQKKA